MTFHKLTPMLTAAAAALLLGACGATTSGALKTQAALSAASTGISAPETESSTMAMTTPTTQVGDGTMSCTQLTAEIRAQDARIETAQKDYQKATGRNIEDSALNAAASFGLAKTGVMNKVPFGNSMAKSFLGSSKKAKEKKAKAAEAEAQNAALRRSTLMGIYTGKRCE